MKSPFRKTLFGGAITLLLVLVGEPAYTFHPPHTRDNFINVRWGNPCGNPFTVYVMERQTVRGGRFRVFTNFRGQERNVVVDRRIIRVGNDVTNDGWNTFTMTYACAIAPGVYSPYQKWGPWSRWTRPGDPGVTVWLSPFEG